MGGWDHRRVDPCLPRPASRYARAMRDRTARRVLPFVASVLAVLAALAALGAVNARRSEILLEQSVKQFYLTTERDLARDAVGGRCYRYSFERFHPIGELQARVVADGSYGKDAMRRSLEDAFNSSDFRMDRDGLVLSTLTPIPTFMGAMGQLSASAPGLGVSRLTWSPVDRRLRMETRARRAAGFEPTGRTPPRVTFEPREPPWWAGRRATALHETNLMLRDEIENLGKIQGEVEGQIPQADLPDLYTSLIADEADDALGDRVVHVTELLRSITLPDGATPPFRLSCRGDTCEGVVFSDARPGAADG